MNFRYLLTALIATTCITVGTPAEAQTAEEAAKRFLDARARSDWKAVSESMSVAQAAELQAAAARVFQDEGRRTNAARKYFLGPSVSSDDVRTMPPRIFASGYLSLMNLVRASRNGYTEFLGDDILHSWQESDSLTHVVFRSKTRQAGIGSEYMGVLSLRKIDSKWFVLLDEEIALARTVVARAEAIFKPGKETVKTLDLRSAKAERGALFSQVALDLAKDPLLKYRILVGKDKQLAAEMDELARALLIQYRVQIEGD